MKSLPGNLPDPVVGEVDHFEHLVVVPQPEDVPIQLGDVISVEDQDLRVVRQQLEDVSVFKGQKDKYEKCCDVLGCVLI